jgi:serine/threonine protein kinase, bacterial
MSYCVNPDCPQPKNPIDAFLCQACGARLLVRNRYRVTKSLGQGGFGATFVAIDVSLPGEPICVIKQLRPSNNHEKFLRMARELFEREARTLGKIGNHPQIPRLLDFFEERRNFYLVQEYVSGHTIHQEVKQTGLFKEEKIRDFLIEILPVITYIHSQQVIHRDIKPANILRRDQDGKLVLIDFGAVKNYVAQMEPQEGVEQGSNTQFAVGTSGYAPPEQLAMRPIFASDLYALGVTCIYLMTGKSPKDIEYNPSTGEMMWQKHVQLGKHMTQVLGKMLEVSVRYRYRIPHPWSILVRLPHHRSQSAAPNNRFPLPKRHPQDCPSIPIKASPHHRNRSLNPRHRHRSGWLKPSNAAGWTATRPISKMLAIAVNLARTFGRGWAAFLLFKFPASR